MDPKLKTALAIAIGAVIGVTVFGGALASHALVRAVVTGAPAHASQAMECPQGGQYGAPQPFGGCPGDAGCSGDACPEGQRPMMGERGGCPQGGPEGCPQADAGACPQGGPADCPQGTPGDCPQEGACPGATDSVTSES